MEDMGTTGVMRNFAKFWSIPLLTYLQVAHEGGRPLNGDPWSLMDADLPHIKVARLIWVDCEAPSKSFGLCTACGQAE